MHIMFVDLFQYLPGQYVSCSFEGSRVLPLLFVFHLKYNGTK